MLPVFLKFLLKEHTSCVSAQRPGLVASLGSGYCCLGEWPLIIYVFTCSRYPPQISSGSEEAVKMIACF